MGILVLALQLGFQFLFWASKHAAQPNQELETSYFTYNF